MNRMAQELVAGPTDANFVEFAGLVRDRRRSGNALKHFMAAVAIGIDPDGGQQPRRQEILGSGQAAKQMVIGMFFEKSFDLLTVELQLQAQGAQEFTQAHGQLALGRHDGIGSLELIGSREDLQAFFGGLGPP